MEPRAIRFSARDGFMLAGDLYENPDPRVAVIISAGTGFPRRFYRHLAADLAARGAMVLTYDYRGIGDSSPGNLAASGIDMPDWGRLDLAAAVDRMARIAPGIPLTHVAHSVGGHFVGLVPNHERIARHAFVSVGTGYFPRHHLTYAPAEVYFWWLLGPVSLRLFGHIKSFGGWSGEPLPPKVFRSWRRWCHRPDYFAVDLDTALAPQHFAAIRAPIRSWIFSDDPIATPATSRDLMAFYSGSDRSLRLAQPSDFGVRRIGHDGAFRPGLNRLWDEVWHWLAEEKQAAA